MENEGDGYFNEIEVVSEFKLLETTLQKEEYKDPFYSQEFVLIREDKSQWVPIYQEESSFDMDD